MKEYHILNGDGLKNQLQKLNVEKIILRECLVEGNPQGSTLGEVFTSRASFFEKNYAVGVEEFQQEIVNEISKITAIESGSKVYLWFENDLFCQVNLWFATHILHELKKEISLFLVSPIKDSWMGFGMLSYDELIRSLENKKELSQQDQIHLTQLWKAYQSSDWGQLRSNAKDLSLTIDHIEEVVEAHIERFPTDKKYGRPEESLRKIIKELGDPSFPKVFKAFCEKEGIYGFGDLQVKRIMDNMI